jgi:GNAT superfamily N-acetyltransferase
MSLPWSSRRWCAWRVASARRYRSTLACTLVQRAYPRHVGIEVLPATGRWDDFASFMVPRQPGGRGCVCMVYRNSSLDMPGRIARMRALCQSPPGPGVLAYADGEVAGWCSVAPKATYRALVNSRTIPHVQDEDAWSVVCFVVRPGFRRRGLMHHLLEDAAGHAHAMGATALEGYPVDPGGERIDQTSGYAGTVQLFEAHRFRRVCQTAGRRGGKPRWLVRRELP